MPYVKVNDTLFPKRDRICYEYSAISLWEANIDIGSCLAVSELRFGIWKLELNDYGRLDFRYGWSFN